jgi:TPR repeat protein
MMLLLWTTAAFAQTAPTPEQMACDSGKGSACGVLGNAYAKGQGVPKDVFRAAQLYRLGCEHKDAHSCMFLAEAYRTGVGTKLDQVQAVTLYTQACEIGDPLACRSVGDLYTMGALGMADGKNAGVWYKLGCDLGDAQACTAAGLWVERGDGLLVDGLVSGLPLFQKGCEHGHHRACALMAERYLRGSDGAPKDPRGAYVWYGKGCVEPIDVESCRELGQQLLAGDYVTADPPRGRDLLDRACFLNDAMACRYLGAAELKEKSWAEALVVSERGCDLGDTAACRLAERARLRLLEP